MSTLTDTPTVVPDALRLLGPVPEGDEECRICGDRYDAHSGVLCSICRRPVEHHVDVAEMDDEVAGLARMARARAAIGVELSATERWCIEAVAA